MRTKEIGKLLGSLDQAERNYLKHCMDTSKWIRDLVRETGATNKEISMRFDVPRNRVDAFINGGFNYDIRRMAILNAWWFEIEQDKLKGKEPIRAEKL
jgi:hypothetical protein